MARYARNTDDELTAAPLAACETWAIMGLGDRQIRRHTTITPHRIIFDGLNLALEEGTGAATYARMLTHVARDLGYNVGVVYGSPQAPSRNPILREIALLTRSAIKKWLPKEILNSVAGPVCC